MFLMATGDNVGPFTLAANLRKDRVMEAEEPSRTSKTQSAYALNLFPVLLKRAKFPP